MKIVMISDVTEGGAATACRRLCRGLRNEGASVRWLSMTGASDRDAASLQEWPNLGTLFLKRMVQRAGCSAAVSRSLTRWHNAASILSHVRTHAPDVINVHNVHDATDFRLVRSLVRVAPVVWTMHDAWPLTGGCSYPYGCDAFGLECRGGCTRESVGTGSPGEEERSRRRRFLLAQCGRMTLVSPSKWLADMAMSVLGAGVNVKCVPNSLDLDVFRPVATTSAVRACLGLPRDAEIIATTATWFSDERKGGRFLAEAVERLPHRADGRRRIVLGIGDTPAKQINPAGWHFTGRIHDEELLNLYYNAADVYVLPTLADNLPNTLLESHAAGTPCIAFDSGGCGEVIRDGETGFLVKHGNVDELAMAIRRMLSLAAVERTRLRTASRAWALNQYAPERQAKAYLYECQHLVQR